MLHYRLDGVRWPDEEQWLPALELSFFMRKGAEGWLQGYSVGAGLTTWRIERRPPTPMLFNERPDVTAELQDVEEVADESDDDIFCIEPARVPPRRSASATIGAYAPAATRQADQVLALPAVTTLLNGRDRGLPRPMTLHLNSPGELGMDGTHEA